MLSCAMATKITLIYEIILMGSVVEESVLRARNDHIVVSQLDNLDIICEPSLVGESQPLNLGEGTLPIAIQLKRRVPVVAGTCELRFES